MSAHVLRIDLSQGACDFEPIALEPGVPMLDRSRANYAVLRRWCGDLVAEPAWENSGEVRFFLRDEQQGRLADAACIPATRVDLAGACRAELAKLLERFEQAKPSSLHEQAVLRAARSALMNLEKDDGSGVREGCFVKYRETAGPWRLAWCWGFRRKHPQPATAAICKNPECRQLFLCAAKGKPRCPGCAVITPPRRARRRVAAAAVLIAAVLFVAVALFWAGRASTRFVVLARPVDAGRQYESPKSQAIAASAAAEPGAEPGAEQIEAGKSAIETVVVAAKPASAVVANGTTAPPVSMATAGAEAAPHVVAPGEIVHSAPAVVSDRAGAATAGEALAVDLVVDFGNSRSGALLLEASAELAAPAKMMPFELLDRYRLDAWDAQGQPRDNPAAQWFSSKTRWCNAPYQTPAPIEQTEYVGQTLRTLLRRKHVVRERSRCVQPDLFEDLSLARIGRESDDLGQHINLHGELRLGVSSPKRYLWADDESWLEGAFWHMADPYDRSRTGAFATKLAGRMLAYLHSGNADAPHSADMPEALPPEEIDPAKPRHPPRVLMAAALYELLCQAYCFANSPRYRMRAGDAGRARELRSLSLSFPSGMFQAERECWQAQAERAIQIFQRTLGKRQRRGVALHFGIDEASAVHLAYLWSELQILGQDARLWFSLLGRHEPSIARPSQTPSPAEARTPEVRIACIDIGGGTSNLMIAAYQCRAGVSDSLEGRVLHRDSVTTAGDELVKRLLERIIVPTLVSTLGIEPADALLLFGPEVPRNRGFRAQRIEWMSRLLMPLAETYLQRAAENDRTAAISHTDPAIVDPAILELLGTACNQLRGAGYYNLWQDLRLTCDPERFREVAGDVFDDLLRDYCQRIVAHDCDVVLLAGQPTKLEALREMIRGYLPLPDSRIVPMHHYYAGNWYPYQAADGSAPGRIVDPKSAVVVGAAVNFLAAHGWLPQFQFHTEDGAARGSYYWGAMTEANGQLRRERTLFRPIEADSRDAIEFKVASQRMLIGRTPSDDPRARATPIYQLRVDLAGQLGPIDVSVRLRRVRSAAQVEECLTIDSVSGTVAGEPACLGRNVLFGWRTLADERFFLDTGGLDHLELETQPC
ncbi:MAG TPA: virulence factor SrfB [Pirellulales bacterium]|jgi:hypothetical protein|nr:virulence factor SrfB [Pirellulales bacterium]